MDALRDLVHGEWGYPKYRAAQIHEWVHKRGAGRSAGRGTGGGAGGGEGGGAGAHSHSPPSDLYTHDHTPGDDGGGDGGDDNNDAATFATWNNLPRDLRNDLAARARLGGLACEEELVSVKDGTVKVCLLHISVYIQSISSLYSV